MTGWEGDPHVDLVHELITGAEEGAFPQLIDLRCSGKRGACGEAVGVVGATEHGPLGQFIREGVRGDSRLKRRGPSQIYYDLLTMPGAREIRVGCPQGHGPWTVDRSKLMDAIRTGKKSVRVVEVSMPLP